MRYLILCLLLACPGADLTAAQERRRLDAGATETIAGLYNAEGTLRLMGDSRIEAAATLPGGVAVLEGDLTVAGRVGGDVLVVNGTLEIGADAQIDGRAIVVGGVFRGADTAVRGGVILYERTLNYELREGLLVPVRAVPTDELAAGRNFDFGRTDIIVTARPGYNRVEGLPILMGPRVTLGRSNPSIVEALVTYRTAAGLEIGSDDFGYSLRLEQFLAGRRAVRLGLRIYEEVVPIERSGISDREASLAAFVLHRDYRDHYTREGVAAYLRIEPRRYHLDLRLEYADERHNWARARRPWSLVENDQPWRLQPLAAVGDLRRLTASLTHDTRNEPDDPTYGWWIAGDFERGLGGTLVERFDGLETAAARNFLHGTIDLRRYARLGPGSRLALRVAATGSLDGGPLPVQRQHALGGEGSLPGFALHQFNCGGGDQAVRVGETSFQRYYGCDRAALLQLEYQADLGFLERFGPFQRVRLAGFVDAGRAWTGRSARGSRTAGNDDFALDTGLGLRLGPLGAYWAFPVSGRGEPMNFFLRLGPRF